MQLMIKVTDAEYAMLKAYAAARRKYEVGKGFNIDAAIAQMVSIGIEAISDTSRVDTSSLTSSSPSCLLPIIRRENANKTYTMSVLITMDTKKPPP